MIPAHMQGAVQEEVQRRQSQALEDLAAKYSEGKGGKDVSVDGPTGSAYKEQQDRERQAKKLMKDRRLAETKCETTEKLGDDDDENDDGDHDLRELREQRLRQIKANHIEKVENIGKGHGSYREISQDEFLAQVTSSKRVLCHFYHREFPRCNIIDHHLQRLVARHVETKFIKIDAEKAPFFIDKLKIRTIPTVIFFFDGVAVDKLIGFEGLSDNMPPGKEDEWPTITLARLLGAKGIIDNDAIVDDDEIESANKAKIEEMRKQIYSSDLTLGDDDDDFDI